MALREEVILDIRAALRQLDELQSQLSGFNTPITIPVEVRGEEAIADLRRQADAADTTVDIDVDTFGLEQADQVFEDITGEAEELRGEITQVQDRADRLGRELDDMGGRGAAAFGRLRSAVGPLLATLGVTVGIREFVQQLNAAVQAASALNESVNAINVIFGDAAPEILEFGENAAQSVGLANVEFNQLATVTGQLLQGLGLGASEAAEQTLVLTERSADLASVLDTDVSDALGAINAALRGETEPIRRFVGDFSQASVQAQAVADGLAEVGEELDPTQRALASINLILEQSDRVAGDFANTSESLANRQRRLRGDLIDTQAVVGEELTPAFSALLDATEELVPAIEGAAPIFGVLADSVGVLVEAATPLGRLFAEAAGGIGQLVSEVAGIDAGPVADLEDAILAVANPAGRAAQLFFDIRDRIGRGYTDTALEGFLERVAERAEEGVDPLRLLEDSIASFEASGADFAPVLESIADAAGLGDEDFRRFVESLVLAQGQLGLTASQVRILRDLLNDLGGGVPTSGGALVGFATDLSEATFSLEQFRDAQINAFSQTDADRVLRETFGELPTVISDLDTLRGAADTAGLSIEEFIASAGEDVVINVDPAIIQIGTLIEGLQEVDRLLGETTTAPEVELNIEYDAEGNISNLTGEDGVIQQIIDAATEEADFEADLGEIIINADGKLDLAQFIQGQDEDVAAALAEAFALDEAATADAQAALDGSLEGLGQPAATKLAEKLETAVPEEIAALKVFAEENFVSDVIRQQIGESALGIGTELETAIGGLTIQPEITIDLSKAQITGLINTGSIGIGDGFGDQPGTGSPPPPPRTGPGGIEQDRVVVNINNPTTQNVETSATQAAQTIQAVASSLVKVD